MTITELVAAWNNGTYNGPSWSHDQLTSLDAIREHRRKIWKSVSQEVILAGLSLAYLSEGQATEAIGVILEKDVNRIMLREYLFLWWATLTQEERALLGVDREYEFRKDVEHRSGDGAEKLTFVTHPLGRRE